MPCCRGAVVLVAGCDTDNALLCIKGRTYVCLWSRAYTY